LVDFSSVGTANILLPVREVLPLRAFIESPLHP
jgi:hypothetical protein